MRLSATIFLTICGLFFSLALGGGTAIAQNIDPEAEYTAARSALISKVNDHNQRVASYNARKAQYNDDIVLYNTNVAQKQYLQSIIDDPTRSPAEIMSAFNEWDQLVNWFQVEDPRLANERSYFQTEPDAIDREKAYIDLQIAEIRAWRQRLDDGSNNDAPTSTLSARTIAEFKRFKDHLADANDRQRVANALLAISPFSTLLGKPDLPALVSIAQTEWAALGTAAQGFSAHLRSQLKTFCDLEAVAQSNSPPDFRFWRALSKQFS